MGLSGGARCAKPAEFHSAQPSPMTPLRETRAPADFQAGMYTADPIIFDFLLMVLGFYGSFSVDSVNESRSLKAVGYAESTHSAPHPASFWHGPFNFHFIGHCIRWLSILRGFWPAGSHVLFSFFDIDFLCSLPEGHKKSLFVTAAARPDLAMRIVSFGCVAIALSSQLASQGSQGLLHHLLI